MSVNPTSPAGPPQGPLTTGQAAAGATVPAAPVQAPPDAVATLLQRAVDAVRADAAVRQGGLGSLMANLPPALGSLALPADLKAAIRRVLSHGLPADPAPDAVALKAAVARSGLFLEAQLARAPAAAPADLKAALLGLQQALIAAGARPGPGRPPKVPTPPPSRGGALAGQAPAAASVGADDPPERLVEMLSGETDRALARQTLHQLASLPDETGGGRWMFELPLMTQQGVAIAQFEVERDGQNPGGDREAQASWRARFALDMPPLGPIHVHLRLQGGRAAATLWVERQDSLEQLRTHGGDLAGALAGDVDFRPGAPPTPLTPPPGQLVDRAS